jgi:hypothetical protein
VAGVTNPGGPSPSEAFEVKIPDSWGSQTFAKLTKPFSLRAFDNATTATTRQFLNVTVSSTRVGSLSTKTTVSDELQSEKDSAPKDGYKLDPEIECTVADAEAAAILEQKADATNGGTLYIYEIILIGYSVDDIFNDQDATTFTIVGGAHDKDKDNMISVVKSVAGSWRWVHGYQGTPTQTSSPSPKRSTSPSPS